MSITDQLEGWTVPEQEEETQIRTYSAVGDILAYQRCRRQYGYFTVRGYDSASATQRYFGTLVHDVLDQIHRDYRIGDDLPDRGVLNDLVLQAHDRLVRSGVRAYNPRYQRERAELLIARFLDLFGTSFFQNVQETEFKISRALQTSEEQLDFVLEGVVDVLGGAVSHDLQLPYSTEPDDIEIWDYKSGQVPGQEERELQAYKYQMRVYAELYRQQSGEYPARAVLIFLGELEDDDRWRMADGDPSMFPRLVYPISPNPRHIEEAMTDFGATVEAIEEERSRPYGEQWQAPAHEVPEQTCRACELRYNCASYPQGAEERDGHL
jgi:putative RecB family exonuclease